MNITITLNGDATAVPNKAQSSKPPKYANVATQVTEEQKERFYNFCYSAGTNPNKFLKAIIEAVVKGGQQ